MNYLKSVFWDYPRFQDENYLINVIQLGHKNEGDKKIQWLLTRFLEYGRVVDTFKFFSIHEIMVNFTKLKLSQYARKKWFRLIEVYGGP